MKLQQVWIVSAAAALVLSSGATAHANLLESKTATTFHGEGFISTSMDGDDVTMMEISPSGPAFSEKEIPAQIGVVVDLVRGEMVLRVLANKDLFPNVSTTSRTESYDQQWYCSGLTVTEQTTKQYIPSKDLGRTGARAMIAPVAPTVVYRALCELKNGKRAKTTERTIRLTSNAGGFVLVVQEIIYPQNKDDNSFPDYDVMSGGPLRKVSK